ncbi:RnfABCDGE type electron transport complex subunit G [Lachnospiraceae bacterium ZAX-1]
MNKLIKDALLLTLITVIAGCALGLVYEVTKEPIKKAQAATQQKAYQSVFAEADSFEDYKDFTPEAAEAALAGTDYADNDISGVVVAKDSSQTELGYVISVVSHAGYGGNIAFSIGIQKDGTINGYSITSISETAGLGMKAKESKFYSQFEGKLSDAFEVTKNTATADNQIEAISGATITSNAVTRGVNAGLIYFQAISAQN